MSGRVIDAYKRAGAHPDAWDPDIDPRERRTFERINHSVRTDATSFEVTNVAQYLASIGASGRQSARMWDLPFVTPPFEQTFAEFEVPPPSSEWAPFDKLSSRGVTRVAALIEALDVRRKPEGLPTHHPAYIEAIDQLGGMVGETRWKIYAHLFLKISANAVKRYVSISADIGEDGIFLRTGSGEPAVLYVTPRSVKMRSPSQPAEPYRFAEMYLLPIFFAFSLSHCSNVTVQETTGATSRQERRRRERTGEPPPTRFYTLNIDPMRRALASEGKVQTNGIKKALHICRGHFAHYSEDRPLFGKYSGSFWVPSHVRGDAAAGTVVKDYNVRAPRKES